MSEHTFTAANWQSEVLESNQPVVVDLWAEWCAPCHMISPALADLSREYAGKVKIGKLNVDEHSDVARIYGVMSIPTVLYFKGGELVDRVTGAVPKKVLADKLEQVING